MKLLLQALCLTFMTFHVSTIPTSDLNGKSKFIYPFEKQTTCKFKIKIDHKNLVSIFNIFLFSNTSKTNFAW